MGDKPDLKALRLNRPKTRHVIRLAAIVGQDFARFIAGDEDAAAIREALNSEAAIGEFLTSVLDEEKLAALLAILADLCGITAEQAGEIDLVDQVKIGRALADFFSRPEIAGFLDTPAKAADLALLAGWSPEVIGAA